MLTTERERRLSIFLNSPDGQELMAARCKSQGHEWENCCSVFLQVYQACRWCGETRLP